MHIGVSTYGFVDWGGGVGFIENLLFGLTAVPEKVTLVTVFIPRQSCSIQRLGNRVKRAVFDPLNAFVHLFGRSQNYERWRTSVSLFANICPNIVIYDGSQSSLNRLTKRMGVDVLLPAIAPLDHFDGAWAGYLFDCQHRHLPHFFSKKEIANRDRAFTKMLNTAKCVIVNAQAVAADLDKFYPNSSAKKFALPFAPILKNSSIQFLQENSSLIRKKYNISENFFIISNQFWIHKDHATAFKAFALAVQSGKLNSYELVCTGAQEDCRFPTYFLELNRLIDKLNIKKKVIFTGYIPKFDQLTLLSEATLLLQPTLFEGGPGGGATFDAVALGIPCILSDIPVNLEIIDPLVSFFKTGDAQSLASSILMVTQSGKPLSHNDELCRKSEEYSRQLGSAVYEIARFCC